MLFLRRSRSWLRALPGEIAELVDSAVEELLRYLARTAIQVEHPREAGMNRRRRGGRRQSWICPLTVTKAAQVPIRYDVIGSGRPPTPRRADSVHSQAQVRFLLPSGRALPGGGLQHPQLRAVHGPTRGARCPATPTGRRRRRASSGSTSPAGELSGCRPFLGGTQAAPGTAAGAAAPAGTGPAPRNNGG